MGPYKRVSPSPDVTEAIQYVQSHKKDARISVVQDARHGRSLKEVYAISCQAVCLILAVLTVFYQPLAIFLGQLNQLIVIGFLLAIMAALLQGQVLRTLMIFLGNRRISTIQDVDATLRQDALAPQVSLWLRGLLLALTALPLGLAASYKLFVGGSSSKVLHFTDGTFGFAALPGNQRIGDGLTLLSDLYRPFWIDPALNRTYGFNLFSEDNSTAVVLDTPYPSYLQSLQSQLSDGEYIILESVVNATVAHQSPIDDQDRNSSEYWDYVLELFGHDNSTNGGVAGAYNGLLAGIGEDFEFNHSLAFYSSWNTSRGETFESEAIRIENYRAIYHASWNVSKSGATLLDAAAAETIQNWWQSTANQTTIQVNLLGIQTMFPNFLGEYDWHNRAGAFDFPYPDANSSVGGPNTCPDNLEKCKWYIGVNTVPALSAAMIWARTTSRDSGDRPTTTDLLPLTMYSKTAGAITTTKYIPTLRRTALLLLVLLANPMLAATCEVVRILFRHSPVREDFNAISLLAAAREEDWSVLDVTKKGGNGERIVRIRFVEESNAGGSNTAVKVFVVGKAIETKVEDLS